MFWKVFFHEDCYKCPNFLIYENMPDLWPTDLNVDNDHLFIKDYIYLPSLMVLGQSILKLSVEQGVGDQHCLDLWPTDLNINQGIIYSSRNILFYLPSLKGPGQIVLDLLIAQGVGDQHALLLWPLSYWPEYQCISSTYQGLSTNQVWRF